MFDPLSVDTISEQCDLSHFSPSTRPTLSEKQKTIPKEPTPLFISFAAARRSATALDLILEAPDTRSSTFTKALLDSGATGCFADSHFVRQHDFRTRRLPRAIPLFNIDGTPNEMGSITEVVDFICRYKNHSERMVFYITQLGSHPIILGHNWLTEHNPEIDWKTGKVTMSRCPEHCQHARATVWSPGTVSPDEVEDKDNYEEEHPALVPLQSERRTQGVTVEDALSDNDEEYDDDEDKYVPVLEDEPLQYKSLLPWGAPEERIFALMTISDEYTEEMEIRATGSISARMAADAAKANDTGSVRVPPQYREFEKVFSKESFDELPSKRPWDHAIELTPGAQPFSTKVYPMSPIEQNELDKFLDENLKSHRIRPSKSPMASPVFFVKKKDGSLRFVQDYCKLNAITVKNAYPLPLIPDIMNQISSAKAKYFTKFDVRWGYNNVRIKEGDEWKAAFRTNQGLYEPLVMFFGLTNSPATFQTMMNDLFKDLIDEGFVVVYMDDILIFSETLEHHRQLVRRVLKILLDNKLYLKLEKCVFESLRVEYLGLILSEGQIEMDPVKVAGVRNWPTPRNVTEVRSFLGFCNFYRRFMKDFSKLSKPLNNLTQKEKNWEWGNTEEEAFTALKNAITSTPILVTPDQTRKFRLETDASGYATGGVLSQD